jgi:putative tryptophan/tyrosine transport system substrate-binding protein
MASHIERRKFLAALGGAAAWPLAARAQQTGKVYRIGYLGVTSYAEYAREIEALLRGLRRLGYEEGKNIAIVYQFAEGDYDRLPALASELVTLKVDTIVTHSTPGARAAKQATSTIPIVVTAAADLVSSGLVPSIARPGGNLTGLTFFFAEICAKRVELIKEAVPGATRLGVLVNPANPSGEMALTAMARAAGSLQVELLPVKVIAPDDIAGAFAMLVSRGAQALTFIEDPLLISNAPYIAQPPAAFVQTSPASAAEGHHVEASGCAQSRPRSPPGRSSAAAWLRTRHTGGIGGILAGNNPIHALAVGLLGLQPQPELR